LNIIRTDSNKVFIRDATGGAHQATSSIVTVDGKIFTGFHGPKPRLVKMTAHEIGIPEPSVIAHIQQELRTLQHA
jgi:hypothetical protein